MGTGGNEQCFGGKWRFIRVIGTGSFGQVFEAEREDFGKTYHAAIKAISIPQNESELDSIRSEGMTEADATAYFRQYVEQLVKEFEIMSELKGCTNVVNYEDHEVIPHSDGIGWDIFIRMELLTPLTKKIRSGMTLGDVIKLGTDICNALERCRRKNIIHRDIKPENIFISDFGDYKLGDFGIARTLNTATLGLSKKGTYSYMAPEIYLGREYGPTVDLYSLGIVLYRLLNNNRTPFLPPYPNSITHTDRENAITRQMTGTESMPAPVKADPRLSEVVLKACAYDPADRYQTPEEMSEALKMLRSTYPEDVLNLTVLEATEENSGVKTQPIFVLPQEPLDNTASMPDADLTAVLPKTEEPACDEPAVSTLMNDKVIDNNEKKSKLKRNLKPVFIGCAAAILLIVVLIIAISSGKKSPSVPQNIGQPSKPAAAVENQPAAEVTAAADGAAWQNEFPCEEFLEGRTVEMKTWYRSSPALITNEKDSNNGTLCYIETEIVSDWSEWQVEPIEPAKLLEIETREVYYYRTMTSWLAHNATHTATWTEYGWTGWTETDVPREAVPGSVEVRSETQYRSRELSETFYYANDWSEWSEEIIQPTEQVIVNTKRTYRVSTEQPDSVEAGMGNFVKNVGSTVVFSDVPADIWYYGGTYAAVSSGIMMPDEYLFFRPSASVTIGEVIAAASMIHRIYNGESAATSTDAELYRMFLDDAVARNIVNVNEFENLTAAATRADVAAILYRSLPDAEYQRQNVVDSITDMSSESPYYKYVKWLAEAGVLSWSKADGTFMPDNSISRAEFAVIIDRVVFPEDRVG